MKDLFELLTRKDRIILGVICLFLLAAGAFDLFYASAQKSKYFSAVNRLSSSETAFRTLEADLAQARKDRDTWSRTANDLKDLEENFLYTDSNILTQARFDLERMFQGRGIPVPSLEYEYEEYEQENIHRLQFIFIISENYSNLRQFIHSIETFPKFLILEKIDFLEVDANSGILKLRITLAAYYEK